MTTPEPAPGRFPTDLAGGARAWARRALKAAFPDVPLGRLEKLGRNVFLAQLKSARPSGVVVLLPRPETDPAEDERYLWEARLLAELGHSCLSFRVPQPLAVYQERGRLAQIREFVAGKPLDYEGGQPPEEVVGRVAAGLHRVSHRLPGASTGIQLRGPLLSKRCAQSPGRSGGLNADL